MYYLIQTKCISLKPATRDTRYNRGQVIDYEIPHTTRCQKLPIYYAATQWNSLSPEIRLSPLIDNFKNNDKTKLFEQYHLDNINTKMDFVNITLVPLNVFKVFKFIINSHSIKI